MMFKQTFSMLQHKAFLLGHSSVTDEAWHEMCAAQGMTSYNISLNMPFNKTRYTGVLMYLILLKGMFRLMLYEVIPCAGHISNQASSVTLE